MVDLRRRHTGHHREMLETLLGLVDLGPQREMMEASILKMEVIMVIQAMEDT